MGRCKDERISDYLNALASFFLLNFVVSCSWPTELEAIRSALVGALALGLDVACVLRRISAYHVCKVSGRLIRSGRSH